MPARKKPVKKPARKPAAKKAAKKPARKPAAKKPTRKPAPKKAAAKKKPIRKTAAKKKPARKVAAKKKPVRKTAAKKKPARKTAPKKKPVRKAAPKKAVKKTAAKKPAKKPARKPAKKPAKKTLPERRSAKGFRVNEFVAYPAHGVGQIIEIAAQDIDDIQLEFFVIKFEKEKMVLRVPVERAAEANMRKLADRAMMNGAMRTLRGRARVKRTMWSRRAQDYMAKINSGDLVAIAEVVRDLYRHETQPEQSYSERQLYEQALDRMSREVAAVNKTDEATAIIELESVLAKATGKEKEEAEAEAAANAEAEAEANAAEAGAEAGAGAETDEQNKPIQTP